jgi:hypothetical protein
VKWYKAVRTAEDIKSLCEVATLVRYTYCFSLKKMQLICTGWVQSSENRYDIRGETDRSCQKHDSVSLHVLVPTDRHMLGFAFITSLKSKLCRHQTPQNTKQKSLNHRHKKKDCTSAQRLFNWNASINGHKQGSVGFPQQKNDYQGHLKTSQLGSLHCILYLS